MIEYFNAQKTPKNTPAPHGKSLLPFLTDNRYKSRDYAIYGWFGMPVNITDGKYTYFCCPENNDGPMNAYMSSTAFYRGFLGRENPEATEMGRFLPYTNYPVYKVPYLVRNNLKVKKVSQLFDIESDYAQLNPLDDQVLIQKMRGVLMEMLKNHDSPKDQYERLNLC